MEQINRRRRTAEGGRELLERFGRSGLSVREFCEREGISTACLYRWRAMLGSDARTSLVAKPQVSSPAVPAGFVELGELDAEHGRVEVRLDLGGGVLLSVVRG